MWLKKSEEECNLSENSKLCQRHPQNFSQNYFYYILACIFRKGQPKKTQNIMMCRYFRMKCEMYLNVTNKTELVTQYTRCPIESFRYCLI